MATADAAPADAPPAVAAPAVAAPAAAPSDLKRAAEQEEQVAAKKQKVVTDELEDDSWADEAPSITAPAVCTSTNEKPKEAAEVPDKPIDSATESKVPTTSGGVTSGSSDTPTGASADTKEAAAVVSQEPASSSSKAKCNCW